MNHQNTPKRRQDGSRVKRRSGRSRPRTPQKITSHREAQESRGRSLRVKCPRSSHSNVALRGSGRDPLSLIEKSNEGRVKQLLPVRFTRMLESPFAFFRGTAVIQAHDLKSTPAAGIIVQSCGDCHLMNFGGFASPERTLIFDINDFDETLPAPFEWDVKRLASSFVLASRWRQFGKRNAKDAARTVIRAYRKQMARFAAMTVLDIWYARITLEDVIDLAQNDPEVRKRIEHAVASARRHTSEAVFHKMTHDVDGRPRIIDHPPLIYHLGPAQAQTQKEIATFFKAYNATLSPERGVLFDRYQLVDVASKVVGVGSVGTLCYVTLWMADVDDPLFLQVKQARPSVLEGLTGQSAPHNNGERVVTGQRLMQSASDIFLGWTQGPHGNDFYVRQLRDQKVSPDLATTSERVLVTYAKLCGQTLARAHAKSGKAAEISGYLGSGNNFDDAIADYAASYADQVEKDYEAFRAAIHAGRFPTETSSSEIETAIR
jgi:uncharacterized protein (DUF2252 family)